MGIIKFILLLNIVLPLFVETESVLSSATLTRARSRSMRPLIHRTQPIMKPQLVRSSSLSSLTSKHQHLNTKTNPLPSTSGASKKVSFQHEAVAKDETQPLRMRSVSDINLHEAIVGTHSVHLNPARDGTYARMRRIFLRYGAPAVIGSAVGVGVFEIVNSTSERVIINATQPSNDAINFG